MEEEGSDEMEVAAQEDEKGKAKEKAAEIMPVVRKIFIIVKNNLIGWYIKLQLKFKLHYLQFNATKPKQL